jgi:hypothetical protein
MKRLLSLWKAIFLLLILQGCNARDAVAKAKALIEGDREMIAFFAHPTATLQSAEYHDCVDENDGFKLVYRLTFVSGLRKDMFDSTLGFVFDKHGDFGHSTVEGTTSKTANPYAAASRAIPGRIYAPLLGIVNPDLKFPTARDIQDFILKNGGSEAVFRSSGSPWKQRS